MDIQKRRNIVIQAASRVANSSAVRLLLSPWAWPLEILLLLVANEIPAVISGDQTPREGVAAVKDAFLSLPSNPVVFALIILGAFVSFYHGIRRLEASDRARLSESEGFQRKIGDALNGELATHRTEILAMLDAQKVEIAQLLSIPVLTAEYFLKNERASIIESRVASGKVQLEKVRALSAPWKSGELRDGGGRKAQGLAMGWKALVSDLRNAIIDGRDIPWSFELEDIVPTWEPLEAGQIAGPGEPTYHYVAANNGPLIAAINRADQAVADRLNSLRRVGEEARVETQKIAAKIRRAQMKQEQMANG